MDSDEIAVASAPLSSPPIGLLDADLFDSRKNINTSMDTNTTKLPSAMEPSANRTRLTKEHPNFTQPCNNDEDLRNDLEDFGFSKQQIKDMMSRKEPSWDPAAPPHLLMEDKKTEVSREKRVRMKKNGGRGAEQRYEPLFLDEGSNWALFDPNQGYPSHLATPPWSFEQFETFKPGNTRILEYNIHTHSIRIKSTPPFLRERKEIEYTKFGPKIIEVAVKRRPGRPRKYPLPVNGIASVASKVDRPSAVVSTKTGRPRGRPRKTPVKLEVSVSDSESELTDVEMEDADYGDEIKVKQEMDAD